MGSRPLRLEYGAIGRAAGRLGVHRNHLSKILHGHVTTSLDLATRILADEELRDCGRTLADLTGVQIGPGTPLGGGIVATLDETEAA